MSGARLLIADNNEEFRLALEKLLQSQYDIRSCRTGREALEILRHEPCEILVLDLMLPEVDGITLLERITAEGICPMALAATSLVTGYVLEAAERLGIGYVMRKPCELQAVAARIADLSQRLNPPPCQADPDSIVSELLLSLGFSTKLKGFTYLKEAIVQMANDPDQAITKVLYPSVAKICRCESSHVERSIRHAIDIAWEHRDAAVWEHYFPGSVKRPTNAAFLTRMAEALRQAME